MNKNEAMNLFDPNVIAELESEVDQLDRVQIMRIEIDEALESSINEMNALRDDYSREEAESLIDLCKQNVISTIVGQFGIASLLLEAKDGGSVTTTHNFEKGVTANSSDAARYQNFQATRAMSGAEWQKARKARGYDAPIPSMRKERFKDPTPLHSAYTDRELSRDGRTHLDHVTPAKEIETGARTNLFMSQEERAKMATDPKNFAFVEREINVSKRDQKVKDFVDKKRKDGSTNAEHFEIDREKILECDRKSRRYINKTVNKAAFKKYSKALLATGGKDAAKMAAYSAIGVIMHDLSLAVVEELKFVLKNRGEKTFKELLTHFREKMSETLKIIKAKWKDVLSGSIEEGVIAFLSNIVVFVINLFATTLKKLVAMIRAGFVSLCKAVKLMVHHPETMSQEDANYEAVKLLTAGVIGALSLGLSASIEKFLQSVPGLQPIMMFPIPSFGGEQRTVSDVLSVTLSALAGGLMTTIVIYFMDKMVSASKHDKLQMQMVTASGVVVQCQVAKSWLAMHDAYDFLADEARLAVEADLAFRREIKDSNAAVSRGLKGWEAIKARIGK